MFNVIGIESSCDETSVAIVRGDGNAINTKVLSHELYSSFDLHQKYGGVVPEIAARAHIEKMPLLLKEAMEKARVESKDIDAVAVTNGPGLIGGLLVGLNVAKSLSYSWDVPLIGVNHLEAHALTVRLVERVDFPFLLLLISGGHCQILLVRGVGDYVVLGETIDDALGETFDKVGKMIGLDYPAGREIELLAIEGDSEVFKFPKPLCNRNNCDFSFSGLKTAVRSELEKLKSNNMLNLQVKKDICASFQFTCLQILQNRLEKAIKRLNDLNVDFNTVVIAGGVASNKFIRKNLSRFVENKNKTLKFAPEELCTDNGIMIAWAGLEKLVLGEVSSLDLKAFPTYELWQK